MARMREEADRGPLELFSRGKGSAKQSSGEAHHDDDDDDDDPLASTIVFPFSSY